jgi:predicted dehydrogenase
MITTRHDSHARLVCEALRAGKHVFVEKPLALTDDEVDAIAEVHAAARGVLCVGFNRRFAPLVRRAKEALAKRVGPLAINITVNAGKVPDTHWTKDRSSGGGRVLGEGCHFIDLARHLVGSAIGSIQVLSAESSQTGRVEDIASIQLSFVDGSIAAIQYFANGHARYPKERIDLFWDSKNLTIDNFRRSSGFGVAGKSAPFAAQNKGHRELLAAFFDAVRGTAAPPIPVEELFEVARWSIRASDLAYGRSAGA